MTTHVARFWVDDTTEEVSALSYEQYLFVLSKHPVERAERVEKRRREALAQLEDAQLPQAKCLRSSETSILQSKNPDNIAPAFVAASQDHALAHTQGCREKPLTTANPPFLLTDRQTGSPYVDDQENKDAKQGNDSLAGAFSERQSCSRISSGPRPTSQTLPDALISFPLTDCDPDTCIDAEDAGDGEREEPLSPPLRDGDPMTTDAKCRGMVALHDLSTPPEIVAHNEEADQTVVDEISPTSSPSDDSIVSTQQQPLIKSPSRLPHHVREEQRSPRKSPTKARVSHRSSIAQLEKSFAFPQVERIPSILSQRFVAGDGFVGAERLMPAPTPKSRRIKANLGFGSTSTKRFTVLVTGSTRSVQQVSQHTGRSRNGDSEEPGGYIDRHARMRLNGTAHSPSGNGGDYRSGREINTYARSSSQPGHPKRSTRRAFSGVSVDIESVKDIINEHERSSEQATKVQPRLEIAASRRSRRLYDRLESISSEATSGRDERPPIVDKGHGDPGFPPAGTLPDLAVQCDQSEDQMNRTDGHLNQMVESINIDESNPDEIAVRQLAQSDKDSEPVEDFDGLVLLERSEPNLSQRQPSKVVEERCGRDDFETPQRGDDHMQLNDDQKDRERSTNGNASPEDESTAGLGSQAEPGQLSETSQSVARAFKGAADRKTRRKDGGVTFVYVPVRHGRRVTQGLEQPQQRSLPARIATTSLGALFTAPPLATRPPFYEHY